MDNNTITVKDRSLQLPMPARPTEFLHQPQGDSIHDNHWSTRPRGRRRIRSLTDSRTRRHPQIQ